MAYTATLVAHNGGLDEIALIVAPLIVVGLLLWGANKWAKKQADDDQ
jgi:hypothetical protein